MDLLEEYFESDYPIKTLRPRRRDAIPPVGQWTIITSIMSLTSQTSRPQSGQTSHHILKYVYLIYLRALSFIYFQHGIAPNTIDIRKLDKITRFCLVYM